MNVINLTGASQYDDNEFDKYPWLVYIGWTTLIIRAIEY